MTECQKCQGRAALFLCNRCQNDCADMLSGLIRRETQPPLVRRLPGWIDLLIEASIGQVRMGEGGRHKVHGPRMELNGDKGLAECIATLPDAEKPDRLGRVGLDRARWDIAENPAVDEGTRCGYRECADQLTELIGPLAFAASSPQPMEDK